MDHSYYVVADACELSSPPATSIDQTLAVPEFFPERSVVCWVDFAPDMEQVQSERVLA